MRTCLNSEVGKDLSTQVQRKDGETHVEAGNTRTAALTCPFRLWFARETNLPTGHSPMGKHSQRLERLRRLNV